MMNLILFLSALGNSLSISPSAAEVIVERLGNLVSRSSGISGRLSEIQAPVLKNGAVKKRMFGRNCHHHLEYHNLRPI